MLHNHKDWSSDSDSHKKSCVLSTHPGVSEALAGRSLRVVGFQPSPENMSRRFRQKLCQEAGEVALCLRALAVPQKD